eukprot:6174280-Pleurochrysis_carterae.AAC.2
MSEEEQLALALSLSQGAHGDAREGDARDGALPSAEARACAMVGRGGDVFWAAGGAEAGG